jgi:hypothetical protein
VSEEIIKYFIEREQIQHKNFTHIQNWILFNLESEAHEVQEDTLSQNFVQIPFFPTKLLVGLNAKTQEQISQLQPI